jgi:hypothetical protein
MPGSWAKARGTNAEAGDKNVDFSSIIHIFHFDEVPITIFM